MLRRCCWAIAVPASIGVCQVVGRLLLYFFEHHFDVHTANRVIPCLIPIALVALLATALAPHAIAGGTGLSRAHWLVLAFVAAGLYLLRRMLFAPLGWALRAARDSATRAEAIDQLAGALDRLQLLGLPTNRAFLAACLRHERFRAGQALIPFLQQSATGIRELLQKEERLTLVPCGLQAIFANEPRAESALAGLACAFPRPVRLRHRGEVLELPVTGAPARRAAVTVAPLQVRRWHVQQGAVDLFIDDASFDPPAGSGGGAAADALRAPFNGKVVAVKAVPGASVAPGDVLVVVESMKLEHSLAAARAGVVADVAVEPGQQVAPGQVLVRLAP